MPGEEGVNPLRPLNGALITLEPCDVVAPASPDEAPRARASFLFSSEELPEGGLRLGFLQGSDGAVSVELPPRVVEALAEFLSRRRRSPAS